MEGPGLLIDRARRLNRGVDQLTQRIIGNWLSGEFPNRASFVDCFLEIHIQRFPFAIPGIFDPGCILTRNPDVYDTRSRPGLSGLDVDLLRRLLRFGPLRKRNSQHALLETCIDLVGVDALRNSKVAFE